MRAHLHARRARVRGSERVRLSRGQGPRGAVARRRREADHLQDRPFQHHPGPELDRLRADSPAPAGGRLHHPDPPRPDLPGRQRPSRGRDPPPPRRVDQPIGLEQLALRRRAVLRRGRGEDDHEAAEGVRLSAEADRQPGPQPHDPQPDAGADAGLHGLPGGLRAEGVAGGARRSGRCTRSGWTWRPASSTRCSTCGRAPAGRVASRIPNDAENPYGGGPKRNQWVADRPGVLVATAGHLHPGGLHTDSEGCAQARQDRATCSARRPSTSSPRVRCRGTSP